MNELEFILTDVFNCSRTDLYSNSCSILLKDREFQRLDKILKSRTRQIPLQYILGYTEFMGLRLKIKKGVFIPRPETEILVEAVIDKISKIPALPAGRKDKKSKINILDIGTGSGCIAVCLAKFLKDVNITAIDISQEAINLARENYRLHNTEEQISFLQGDFFSLVKDKSSLFKRKFDIIVSNPPYVPTDEIGVFDKTTLNEPSLALDGGKDGFDFYRRISKKVDILLKKDGFLIMEIGYNQANEIKKIFSCGWAIEEFKRDYQGTERVVVIKHKNNGDYQGIERVCQMKLIRQ